jgi:CubicO group peptidase (beta-lactamase class C family)
MPRTGLRTFLSVCVFLSGALSTAPAAQTPSTDLSQRLNQMLSRTFASDGPGATVIVVKDGNIVFRHGYGLANLETKTAMRPEMVFELGSVTKQFTSTAILMLAEEGKLSLADNIKKFFPDYPDKGAQITVEHLLTHTSGIKSYTDDPKWLSLWREDLTPQQVIDITKDAPLDFAPGTKWSYNNTAYTMLGAIIEKTSGLSYSDFIRQHIFEPLGMSHSLYGSFTRIIPNRAAGYTRVENGWENAPYLSMMQPYSAGALMSNVDDLALWDAAVSSGKLLSKLSFRFLPSGSGRVLGRYGRTPLRSKKTGRTNHARVTSCRPVRDRNRYTERWRPRSNPSQRAVTATAGRVPAFWSGHAAIRATR